MKMFTDLTSKEISKLLIEKRKRLDITRKEFFLLLCLLLPTISLGIAPNKILETLHSAISRLLYSLE